MQVNSSATYHLQRGGRSTEITSKRSSSEDSKRIKLSRATYMSGPPPRRRMIKSVGSLDEVHHGADALDAACRSTE